MIHEVENRNLELRNAAERAAEVDASRNALERHVCGVLRQAALAVQQAGAGWVVTFEASNTGPRTASEVEIEGEILAHGHVLARGRTRIDYLPARSTRKGGILFDRDPTGAALRMRAVGYADP